MRSWPPSHPFQFLYVNFDHDAANRRNTILTLFHLTHSIVSFCVTKTHSLNPNRKQKKDAKFKFLTHQSAERPNKDHFIKSLFFMWVKNSVTLSCISPLNRLTFCALRRFISSLSRSRMAWFGRWRFTSFTSFFCSSNEHQKGKTYYHLNTNLIHKQNTRGVP